jgi:hypothetical protein
MFCKWTTPNYKLFSTFTDNFKHNLECIVINLCVCNHSETDLVVEWVIKGKVVLCLPKNHAMKMYQWSRGATSHILNLRIKWRRVVSFMFQPFHHWGKSSWVPTGHGGKEKEYHHCPLP